MWGFNFVSLYQSFRQKKLIERMLASTGIIPLQMSHERLTQCHASTVQPHERLTQEFIVVRGIIEDCFLVLDKLYEHRFMIEGHERCVGYSVYRIREFDQLPNRSDPFILVVSRPKLELLQFTACVMVGTRVPSKLHYFYAVLDIVLVEISSSTK